MYTSDAEEEKSQKTDTVTNGPAVNKIVGNCLNRKVKKMREKKEWKFTDMQQIFCQEGNNIMVMN